MWALVSLSLLPSWMSNVVVFKKEGEKLHKKQEKSTVQRELAGKLRTPVLTFMYNNFNAQSTLKAISG